MVVNVAIISKNAGLGEVLSQHAVLGGVTFLLYDGLEKYTGGSNFAVFDCNKEEDVSALPFASNNVIYLFPKAGSKYHLAKPFRIGNLFALLAQIIAEADNSSDVAIGDFQFSYKKKKLSSDKQQIDLTEKETEIIMLLLEVRPNSVDKKELLNSVWGYDNGIDTNTLETHMYRLRKKIGNDKFIVTDKDGYKLP